MVKVNNWDIDDVEETVTRRGGGEAITAWFGPWRQEQLYCDERRGTSAKIQRFWHGLIIQSYLTMKVQQFFSESQNPTCH